MCCAERLSGVDLDCVQAARHARPIMTAMHNKASGFDRSALALRQGHPIFVGNSLDQQWPELHASSGMLDQNTQNFRGGSSAKWAKTSKRPLPSSNTPIATGEGSHCSSSARAIREAAASSAAMLASYR